MKTIILFILCLTTLCYAATNAPLLDPTQPVAPQVPDAVSKLIVEQATKHPWIVTLLVVLGIAGRIVQPTLDFAHKVVKETPTVKDDEFVEKVESSAALKWVIKFFAYVSGINPIHPAVRDTPK